MSSNKERNLSIGSELGARIRKLRKSASLGQNELGRLAGLGEKASGYISEVEAGKKIPGSEILFSLSRALDTSMDFIFTGTATVGPADYSNGLPREIRDAIQKAYQMVRDFLSVVPNRPDDPQKEGLFVVTVASLLVAGRQEEIPALMTDLIRSYSAPAKPQVKK